MAHETPWCPIMQLSRTDFQRPFAEFVAEVFSRDPDLPMFKVCVRYVSARTRMGTHGFRGTSTLIGAAVPPWA